MKKKEKKMILILIVVACLIIAILFWWLRGRNEDNLETGETTQNVAAQEFVQTLEDGTKLNTSNKLSETKQFQGLQIKNIQLTNKDDKTELIAEIENPTETDTQAILVDIVLYDKQGQEITTLGGRISPIKAGQTTQFSTTAMIDYSNIYDFELKAK